MATDRPERVSVWDSVGYGFYLIGYAAVVTIGAGIVAGFGWAIYKDPVGGTGFGVIGPMLIFAGIAVGYAGFLGLGYKVVADAVAVGMQMADVDVTETQDP